MNKLYVKSRLLKAYNGMKKDVIYYCGSSYFGYWKGSLRDYHHYINRDNNAMFSCSVENCKFGCPRKLWDEPVKPWSWKLYSLRRWIILKLGHEYKGKYP